LCWKDALSIEITGDGVLIISNFTSVGDSHLTEGTEDKRDTLSTEHVLALPEVKFGSTPHPTNEATRRMQSSSGPSCAAAESAPTIYASTTRQDIRQQDVDEESLLPFLSTDNDHINAEIKLPQYRGLPCFCCNTTCSICLEDFTADESLRLLPCGHVFHTSCILPWLTKRATSCPLCKKCLAHFESES
jgi:RING-finger-containing ubiquitin ligase